MPPPAPPDAGPRITGVLKYDQCNLVRLKAEGVPSGSAILWRVSPSRGVQKATTAKGLLEFAAPPGTYDVDLLVISQGADGLDVAEVHVAVTIGGPAPPPGPPPPGPIPPPPAPPADPLVRELSALYLADPSPTKVPDLMLLAELYRQASDLANAAEITTLSQLAQRVAGAGGSLLPRGRLDTVRKRIGEFVAREFGDVDATLTPDLRAKTSATYAAVFKALKQIGGQS